MVPSGTVYYPHGGDEAHGTEDSDRREVLDGIQPMIFQNSKCRSIRQCQRRHIESHAEGINRHEDSLIRHGTRLTHHKQAYHRETRQQMAIAQESLRLDILIRHNTHQCRHEDRYYTLNGIEPRDFGTHSGLAEIVAHRGEIGSPNSELQEVHHCQAYF